MEEDMVQYDANIDKTINQNEKYEAMEGAREHSAYPVAALVLGIISVIGNLFWYISIPCGVLAIIFGAISSRRMASKLGKAGLILGIVGISLTVFAYISLILLTLNSYWY